MSSEAAKKFVWDDPSELVVVGGASSPATVTPLPVQRVEHDGTDHSKLVAAISANHEEDDSDV